MPQAISCPQLGKDKKCDSQLVDDTSDPKLKEYCTKAGVTGACTLVKEIKCSEDGKGKGKVPGRDPAIYCVPQKPVVA